ncbi:CrcB protein [Mariniphaga anaerophila]|uniref:Fluoride-specific ion channel FluC n=1 Tax=Mariniphaga anaerophila TaxID=1484053 RepID=A0A1M4WPL3_9BACT|nr:fluoride efflux transporter CrcB [Mariniphaga anaerophila]SHE82993.1 CrcB protein [Mariniphaga anaerophila]
MVKSFIIAGIGGFLGSGARFLVSRFIQISYTSVFPWGTFTVNIIGSLLIGIFFGISERGNFMSAEWRLFLTVGFCGGFTTFSSLANDSFLLFQSKEFFRFAGYASLSFMLGLLAVFLGRTLIKLL